MSRAGLAVRGVHKAFGDAPVLRGIDLSVDPGTLVAILGPSGCGKTTLLRLLAGFDRADAGSIALNDQILADDRAFIPSHLRGIGYVPQEGSLFPNLSVADNIGFGLPRSGARAERLAAMTSLIGMAGFEGRMPHELSGGQQQRVALARALALQPTLVLLDEPFNALDANLRRTLCADVRRILKESNATGILVTHDRDEAFAMADTVVVMRNGVIAQTGTPRELYDHPVDLDLARLVGTAVCIPATLKGGVAQTCLGALPVMNSSACAEGRVLAMLRPEQIRPAAAGHDGVDVAVRGSSFLGPLIWLDLLCRNEGLSVPLMACWPAAEADAIGSSVRVVVNGAAMVFPVKYPL
ncbi:ABC transporter ATP-binding protein [Lichenihabitans psoromatis]|uniref:ABC transporter ATP-binding protein n=1 Tax=Lichenihabitans psoromatis TaxID=2528642 RepID=UPI0010366175|nr:ABC transporter ATP-binding protein [Lichenihabitans psoromatis]